MSRLEKIALLVEDEPLVTMLASSILRDLGYTVFEARTKGEADKHLLDASGFTLLFTDVELADGSSGVDLAFEVARYHPTVNIVVTSGRSRPASLPDGALFMPKPYSDTHLQAAILTTIKMIDPSTT